MSHNSHLAAEPAATLPQRCSPDTGSGIAEAAPAAFGKGMGAAAIPAGPGVPNLLRVTMRAKPQVRPAALTADGPLRPGRVRRPGTLLYRSGLAFW